jgi:hypothetical protein
MNKTLIFRKIGGIISEITEQYQYLAETPEHINPLELELFIANSHFLSEHLAILKKLESAPTLLDNPVKAIPEELPVMEYVPEEPVIVPEPVQPAPARVVEAESVPYSPAEGIETPENRPAEVIILPETFPETANEPVPVAPVEHLQDTVPAESEVETTQEELSKKSESMIDQPAPKIQAEDQATSHSATEEKVPTLNEILAAGKSQDNIAAKISRHEDKDLKSMIKLNDKLMFVRDLFNGYSLAYSEAIDLVNRFDNFQTAENFLLQHYAAKNRWSEKQQTVDQFYEILNKRFS